MVNVSDLSNRKVLLFDITIVCLVLSFYNCVLSTFIFHSQTILPIMNEYAEVETCVEVRLLLIPNLPP